MSKANKLCLVSWLNKPNKQTDQRNCILFWFVYMWRTLPMARVLLCTGQGKSLNDNKRHIYGYQILYVYLINIVNNTTPPLMCTEQAESPFKLRMRLTSNSPGWHGPRMRSGWLPSLPADRWWPQLLQHNLDGLGTRAHARTQITAGAAERWPVCSGRSSWAFTWRSSGATVRSYKLHTRTHTHTHTQTRHRSPSGGAQLTFPLCIQTQRPESG